MSSIPVDPLIGARVGRYRIEAPLGRGGMGHVYRALDPDGAPVAVKMVRRDLARDAVFRKRFEREARIARQVVSPHLVPLVDIGEHDGVPFLVERFISGGTLADRLKREGRLAVDVALRMAAQLADALVALAAHDMVHRDVKPANVLLDDVGDAHLTDFGLARDLKGTALTRLDHALGSPHYMSPEQIRGEAVSQASDTYSLGCVLFECLQGGPPFARAQGMRVMWAQLTEAPEDPCAGSSEAPSELGPAVLRALAKDPAQRPPSATAYVDELAAAAGLNAAEFRFDH
jgi:serine/threonine-protein kinase